jgi:hypothetical protein
VLRLVSDEAFNQAETVMTGEYRLEFAPASMSLLLKAAAPSICPEVADTPLPTIPLLPFEVESEAVRVVPFGKCHTPL